jgi:hypothetical protein
MKGTVMHSVFNPTVANDAPAEPDQPTIRDASPVTAGSPSDRRNVVAFFGNRGHWGYYDCNWWEIRMARSSQDRHRRLDELARAA